MAPIYTRIYAQPVEFNRALGYAYDALVKGPYRFDALSAWKGLSERVAQGIYMGQGLLLPHTRVPGLQGPLMSLPVRELRALKPVMTKWPSLCVYCFLRRNRLWRIL